MSAPCPVRVTLDGELTRTSETRGVLTYEGGAPLVLRTDSPALAIEDMAPIRTWTDGDVVQQEQEGWTLTRHHGTWVSSHAGVKPGYWTDDMVSAHLEDLCNGWGRFVVLRYQAAE